MSATPVLSVSLLKKVLFFSVPFLALFIMLELLFRLAGYTPLTIYASHRYPNSPQAYYAISDPQLGFRNRANGSYHYQLIKGNPLSTTDQYGYRNGISWPSKQDAPIILFVGDSTLFCAEVNDSETITSEIATLILPKFNVRILNAGVRGFNTLQAKRMIDECLVRFPSVRIVVYMYCNNDYYHNFNPSLYPTPAPVVRWNSTGDVLLEIEVTNLQIPWGEPFYSPLTGIGDNSQYFVLTHLKSSIQQQFTNDLRSKSVLLHQIGLRMKKVLDPKNIGGGKSVVEDNKLPFHKDDIPFVNWGIPEKLIDKQIEVQAEWVKQHRGDEALEILLRQMRESVERKGAVFLASAFFRGSTFRKGKVDDLYEEFPIRCDRAGVTVIDVSDAFTDEYLSYVAKTTDGKYDGHYNAKGTRTFARALAPKLIPTITLTLPPRE